MPTKESFTISGEILVKKVKEIIAEGNATKITLSDKSGRELMSFPLAFGVMGVLLAPIMAAVGTLTALVTECTITVERPDDDDEAPKEDVVKAEEL